MTVEVHDFDLRFDQRVLAFNAWINTDRDHNEITKAIVRAVKGPRNDANMTWCEGWNDGTRQWGVMCEERGLANDHRVQSRHGGRVLAIHSYVNTDTEAYDIHKVVLRLARGPRLDACVVWSELYEGVEAAKIWGVIAQMAAKAHADPRTQPVKF